MGIDEIEKKLSPFLKKEGFKPGTECFFLPISGLTGDNVKERKNTPAWFKGQSLLDTLDSLTVGERKSDQPLRIPMLDGYRDMGAVMAIGKVEQGTAKPGLKCVVMPAGEKCTITAVNINEEEMKFAKAGENVTLKMHGVSEDKLSKGFVLCDAAKPIPVVTKFKAQLKITELPEERPVLTSGYKCMLHAHVAT